MNNPATQPDQKNDRISIFELIPAVVCIPLGFLFGQFVACKSGYLALGILAGIGAVPVSFLIVAYVFAIAVILPWIICDKLFGGTSPRDEFFDDPA